jgi:uncharacterized protein
MFFERNLETTLLRFSKFPVVVLLGPRQSGKTTLAKNVFKKHTYVNLENPDVRDFAFNDPNRFLEECENNRGIILDEFQYVPKILSYIQVLSDEKKRPGYFVLTGSQNFLMNQAISQSLAGRAGILNLLPFSIKELIASKLITDDVDQSILNGGYPRIFSENFLPSELYPSYIHSYMERDVRQLINVGNLRNFQKFMQLCAGRIGQLLNIEDLAVNCGINRKTADEWLSILEASYIIFLLKPYFKNYNKRITKTPKIYFYDTGLACSLLNIRKAKDLALSSFRGQLFENFIISDFFKQYYNLGIEPPLYFWRDQNGRIEIDCLIDLGSKQIPAEIKSGQTIVSNFFNSISSWNELAKADPENGYIIYAGDSAQKRNLGNVIGWKKASDLVNKLEK